MFVVAVVTYFTISGQYLLATRTNVFNLKQGKSEGFASCDRPSILTQIIKSLIFQPA